MKILNGSTDNVIFFVAVDATDLKTRETGLSSFTVYYTLDDSGAATAMTTPTVAEVDNANMPGVYSLLIDEAGMTNLTAGNDTEELTLHITHAGMAPVTRAIEVYRSRTMAENQRYLVKREDIEITIIVWLRDAITGALKTGVDVTNLDFRYIRVKSDDISDVSAAVDVVELSSLTSAWITGDMWEVDKAGTPFGAYRFDVPNLLFAAAFIKSYLYIWDAVNGSILPVVVEFQMDAFDNLATSASLAALNDFDPTSETVDVGKISGDAAAANNLESQYDGTGLFGDVYPLRQDQGAGIAGGLATRFTMASVTVIQGSQQNLTNANTSDDTRWTGDDDGSGAEFIFRCTPTDTTNIPVDLHFEGYYDEPGAPFNNGATLQIYDFQNSQWDTAIQFSNASSDELHDVALSHVHEAPGSGTIETVAYTIGDVLIKFEQDAQETGDVCLLIDYMTVGYVGSLTPMRGTDDAATEAKQDVIDTNVDTVQSDVTLIKAETDLLDGMIIEDSGGNQFTVAALENAPTAEMDATELVAAMKAITGITVGGTWTWEKIMKINAAWIAGNWRVKPSDGTKQELMDAEDNTEIILEQTLKQTTPYRTITVKI